jgi:glutamate synthase (NADPH/NADH) large chain/glutamate synthase (ferredoxin)
MSGGELYVFDSDRLERRANEHVVLRAATPGELLVVRELLERHERSTRSARAAEVLARWDELAARFVRVAPRAAAAESAESTG